MNKQNYIAPKWEEETMKDRAIMCIKFLYVHGIITTSEKDKAEFRLEKERYTKA